MLGLRLCGRQAELLTLLIPLYDRKANNPKIQHATLSPRHNRTEHRRLHCSGNRQGNGNYSNDNISKGNVNSKNIMMTLRLRWWLSPKWNLKNEIQNLSQSWARAGWVQLQRIWKWKWKWQNKLKMWRKKN